MGGPPHFHDLNPPAENAKVKNHFLPQQLKLDLGPLPNNKFDKEFTFFTIENLEPLLLAFFFLILRHIRFN